MASVGVRLTAQLGDMPLLGAIVMIVIPDVNARWGARWAGSYFLPDQLKRFVGKPFVGVMNVWAMNPVVVAARVVALIHVKEVPELLRRRVKKVGGKESSILEQLIDLGYVLGS